MAIFETALEIFIDMNHELVLLAQRLDWSEVEVEFSKYYCKDNGRPSVPARKMVGLSDVPEEPVTRALPRDGWRIRTCSISLVRRCSRSVLR